MCFSLDLLLATKEGRTIIPTPLPQHSHWIGVGPIFATAGIQGLESGARGLIIVATLNGVGRSVVTLNGVAAPAMTT